MVCTMFQGLYVWAEINEFFVDLYERKQLNIAPMREVLLCSRVGLLQAIGASGLESGERDGWGESGVCSRVYVCALAGIL